MLKNVLIFYSFTSIICACRLWYVIPLNNQNMFHNELDLQIFQGESEYFQLLGNDFESWSLFFYDQNHQMNDVYRSGISASSDSNYQSFINNVINYDGNLEFFGGHLRSPSSGAYDIINPHPFFFNTDNKTYSLIHNGTISKSILLSLITENGSDSTWIINNPPNTYNDQFWYHDSGWANVVDSELLLLWIMKNIASNENTDLENIIFSIQELEVATPNAEKNFILSDGEYAYAYRSENDDNPDLYFSDTTSFFFQDSLYKPNHIAIMSQIPVNTIAEELNWISFDNESLMTINSKGDYFIIKDFVNHAPEFEISSVKDTVWILDGYSLSFFASDFDDDSLSYQLLNNPDWVYLVDQVLFAEPEELGQFNFQVLVNDGELEDLLYVTLEIVDYRAIITSLEDVPNDDGGWIYIKFLKSFYDGENFRNNEFYHIERFSNDNWISVGSSAAYGADSYTVQVMTEVDSSNDDLGLSYFRVLSSMDEGLWVSEVDSGYSINNNILEVENDEQIPNQYSLFQNYPNPFNPKTLIKYILPEISHINIKVIDLHGNLIKTLVNKIQSPGYKAIYWDGTNHRDRKVSSGVYLYILETENFYEKKKMILLK